MIAFSEVMIVEVWTYCIICAWMCVRVKWLSYPKLPSSNRVQPEICLFQGYIIKAQLQKIYLATIGKSYKTYVTKDKQIKQETQQY